MKSKDIRDTFLRFFEARDHRIVPSASVVPKDDPTLYFTNAGMNQFKDVFLGLGTREYTRAVDTQRCLRVSGKHNDLEEVGFSPWHHTYFEMLGNWSFGDYFKKEAIDWAWQLVTQEFGLEKERVWATVFEGNEADGQAADVESEDLWKQYSDLPDERILRLPATDNFWEMGETGPCGPCSEIHYYIGDDPSGQRAAQLVEGSRDFVEIWNLVFIQYNRDETGALQTLPAKHVDTGMGFERICSLLQKTPSNYQTDLFTPLIGRIAELTGKDPKGEYRVAMQVVADHVRALSFAIADGALPANEGAGYVLRRILRRAARYGRDLGMNEPFVYQLTATIADIYQGVFPEVVAKQDHVALVIRSEEEGFGKTLDRGLEIFERFSQKGRINGEDAFQLYDTYGFPLDLTQLMARERDLEVDIEGFDVALEGQRQRARQATKSHFKATEGVGDAIGGPHSRFIGYDQLAVDAKIVDAASDETGLVRLFLDQTPFYAESGGQAGDKGRIEGEGFVVTIEDTVKARGGIMHVGRLVAGQIEAVAGSVRAQVDTETRLAAARNHTATHLMHEALRRVLGDHVGQMGSLVAPERLRFDFSHFAAVEPDQLRQIEVLVNEQIRADLAVDIAEEALEEAKARGARALFGEKYDERVRVVEVGDYSMELCGGTHVASTGQIGLFSLATESGIAAGTRRIEALSGTVAEAEARRQRDVMGQVSTLLNASEAEVADKLKSMLHQHRVLERELEILKGRMAGVQVSEWVAGADQMDGFKILSHKVTEGGAKGLRSLADEVRGKLGSGVGVLAAVDGDKVFFVATVTDDLIRERGLKAGDIVRDVAQIAGGSGGGKAHMAQAGGRDAKKTDEALNAVQGIVGRLLAVQG